MYIRGGYNVYPVEVENCLGQHPGVDRVAVVGTAGTRPSARSAWRSSSPPTAPSPTLDELRGWCRARMADYKAPDCLVLVDELPLTPMSKVDKRALAPLAEQAEEAWER